jgi:ABC-type Co2+ transport system permease subunit
MTAGKTGVPVAALSYGSHPLSTSVLIDSLKLIGVIMAGDEGSG